MTHTTCPYCQAVRDCESWRFGHGTTKILTRCDTCGKYFTMHTDGTSEPEKTEERSDRQ